MHPRKYVHLSLLISEVILFILMITICVIGFIFNNKKEYVWMASKILTIKQILKDNMNNTYPIEYISDNEIITLNKNYEYFLNHSTKIDCEPNFKKCGILDTYGNIMCIPENDSCPINEIIVDSIDKKNDYINKGYKYAQLEKLDKKFNLYYTNKEKDKEIVVNLNFTDEQPKYIFPENFIFDEDAYDKYLVSHYSGSDSDYGGYDSYDGGGYDGGGDYGGDGGGIGDGGGYWRNLDGEILYGNSKETKYIHKKFEEKKNNDIYFKKIHDNLYSKNYIGFESYEQMDIFMNTDLFSLYLKIVPNLTSTIISIFCALVLLGLCIFSLTRLNYEDRPNDHGDPDCITCSKCAVGIIYFLIFIGYYSYFIYAYCKINKSPIFREIKKIKSDNFIKGLIDEIERVKNEKLVTSVIILFSISFIFFILTWIFQPLHQIYLEKIARKEVDEKSNENKNKDKKDIESCNEKINEKKLINDFKNIGKLDDKKIKDIFDKKSKGEIKNNSNSSKENSTKNDENDITK